MDNTELYDSEFKEIKSLNWLPWVGSSYTDEKCKLLVAGESNYAWDNKDEDPWLHLQDRKFNRYIIQREALGRANSEAQIYRNIERALLGSKNLAIQDTTKLWKKCAYYNFIQRAMENKKARPTGNDYVEGWVNFFPLLEVLKPNCVLVCNTEAPNKYRDYFNVGLSKHGFQIVKGISQEKVGRINGGYVKIQKGDYIVEILFIRQPSSFFSWEKWHKYIKSQIPEHIETIKK